MGWALLVGFLVESSYCFNYCFTCGMKSLNQFLKISVFIVKNYCGQDTVLGTGWGILASTTCNNQGRFMGWGGE